jgi:hypothetical protein
VTADRPWADDTPASKLVVIALPGSLDERWLWATVERMTAPGP